MEKVRMELRMDKELEEKAMAEAGISPRLLEVIRAIRNCEEKRAVAASANKDFSEAVKALDEKIDAFGEEALRSSQESQHS
jgi:hypothetical protein